jgi:hypothetical protein
VTGLEQLRERLCGFRFPPGRLHVHGYESWLAADCFGQPLADGDELHPAWVLVGGLRDMGLPFAELFQLAEARVEDGIFYGETSIEQEHPLMVGVDYTVEGEILDLTRRNGARLGTFDLMTFQLRLVTDDGLLAASSSNTFVFGRRA